MAFVTETYAELEFRLSPPQVGPDWRLYRVIQRPVALAEALAKAMAINRNRSSWNNRLSHWERPASDSEEAQIERAATMVRKAIAGNRFLMDEGIAIRPQGSYHNNTNVRQEADMDLRAMHPLVYSEYGEGVVPEYARQVSGLTPVGRYGADVARDLRAEMAKSFTAAFGKDVVTVGSKAIRIDKKVNSRADVDVVPTFDYRWIAWNAAAGRFDVTCGVAIFGTDGSITRNYPDDHTANGRDKRARTRHRFKKVVRSLKRLRDELVEFGMLKPKRVPSFFIESLVHWVPDWVFLCEDDDRYGRVIRVLDQMAVQLKDLTTTDVATEINGIKYLFHPTQPWTVVDAQVFIAAARARLAA